MFAIAFDLVVDDVVKHYPKNVSQAYTDVSVTLSVYGFVRIQGSVYVTEQEDMVQLFRAISALKAMAWFPRSVRDIRAFRIEQWSDFTSFMKE